NKLESLPERKGIFSALSFSTTVKNRSFFNEFICLILWEKVMHAGEEEYSPVRRPGKGRD
ncbi:hypothetical protein L1964_RS13340, partial [Escherichia coli]